MKIQKFFDNPRQCFALLPQVNFPSNNLNFHWRWRWWDRIQAIFLNPLHFKACPQNSTTEVMLIKGLDIMTKRLTIISDNLQEPHQLFIQDRAAFIECLWQCYANKTFLTHSKFYGSWTKIQQMQCNAVLAPFLSFFVKSVLASYTHVLKDIHAWILSLLLQCVKKYKAIIILHCKYIYTVKLQMETGHM